VLRIVTVGLMAISEMPFVASRALLLSTVPAGSAGG